MNQQKLKTKDMLQKNAVAILNCKANFDKQQWVEFIKQYEEVVNKKSKIKTILLNADVVEFKGFVRKQPRIVNIPKAVRRSVKVFQQLETVGIDYASGKDVTTYSLYSCGSFIQNISSEEFEALLKYKSNTGK